MTPKEKALELVLNFYLNGIQNKDYSMEYEDGKKCALICIDEILKNITQEVMTYKPFMMNTDYWQEVKEEINKL